MCEIYPIGEKELKVSKESMTVMQSDTECGVWVISVPVIYWVNIPNFVGVYTESLILYNFIYLIHKFTKGNTVKG